MRHMNRRSVAGIFAFVAFALVLPRASRAHDDEHKRLSSLKLKMSYAAGDATKSRFSYKTKDQTAISGLTDIDPRTVETNLIVRGTGALDGATGVIHLDPTRWTPIGTDGWQYKHDSRVFYSQGVQKIRLKEGAIGGSLQIKAKGSFWPYAILDDQATVEIFLNIGGNTYCAQYGTEPTELTRNEAGSVQGKTSNPPAECNPVCGNAILEVAEECDDGNDADSDTCSNACLGCLPQDVEYASTFDAIQAIIFDDPTYACSNDTCHGANLEGNLDLRPGASYAQLVNVASANPPNPDNALRVFPGDQDLSFLYNKIASKTLGTPNNVGTSMPVGPATVTPEHLEALRRWIRGGAPETTVVAGTSELLGSCLPEPTPLKIPEARRARSRRRRAVRDARLRSAGAVGDRAVCADVLRSDGRSARAVHRAVSGRVPGHEPVGQLLCVQGPVPRAGSAVSPLDHPHLQRRGRRHARELGTLDLLPRRRRRRSLRPNLAGPMSERSLRRQRARDGRVHRLWSAGLGLPEQQRAVVRGLAGIDVVGRLPDRASTRCCRCAGSSGGTRMRSI